MNTPNLDLEPLVSAQAQKHVTVNEAFARIDAATQLAVLDRDAPDPPASPADGDRYLLPTGATGSWNGRDGTIAAWEGATGGWMFLTPRTGWRLWLIDEGKLVVFTDTGWQEVGGDSTSLNPASGGVLGVNTTANATNRLAVKSDAALFSHDDVTPGTGDMRLTLNKALPADDTSLTFQTGYSARAQVGLAGDDDLHFKVSPDGANFHEAMIVDRNVGTVTFPGNDGQPNRLVHMGSFNVSTTGGIKRFNFRLKGLGISDNTAFYVQVQGYAYGSARALDLIFSGYNYVPTTSAVIRSHNLDRAGTGLQVGTTKTATGIYIWFEADEYFTNGSLSGAKVFPGGVFEPAQGFDFVKTDSGVAVT